MKLDLLFVSQHALWPADQGCKIHGSQMALAAAKLGARVGVACMEPARDLPPTALSRLLLPWPEATEADRAAFEQGWRGAGSWLRHRLARHQGLEPSAMAGLVSLVERHRPAAVIGVGLHAPLLLRGLSERRDTKTVWYAADELIYFNLSCMRRESVADGARRLHTLALHAALENAFARGLDGAIGVSPLDTRLLRLLAGTREAVTIRNGVDLDAFAPSFEGADPHSLVFWGRLDFEPNIDAVTWFAHAVWPRLRAAHPHASWAIVGKKPHPRVVALSKLDGIRVLGEVPDIRPLARAAAVTVLPMRCGGGIKNKLLEAAAMGRPIIASPKAVEGLDLHNLHPFRVCASSAQWAATIGELWSKPLIAAQQGRRARTWAKTCHSWNSAARSLLDWVSRMNGGGAWDPPVITTGRAA